MERITVPLIILTMLLVACNGSPATSSPTSAPTIQPSPTSPSSQPTMAETPFVPEPAVETTSPTKTSGPSPKPAPTEESTPQQQVDVEPDWSGDWEVYIANPRVSIVKEIQFILPMGEDLAVTAEWYEGTRLVYLDAVLSEDGRTITGTFYSSDVDVLDVVLTLSPDGTYFTGTADSADGEGQFCGARPGNPRPSPCRGDTK